MPTLSFSPFLIKPFLVARFLHLYLRQTKGDTMKNKDLLKKIAKLESMNDQIAAELNYLEHLTRALGFAEGLKTLKAAALEMLETDYEKGVKTENDSDQ